MLKNGIEHIINQVVDPKIKTEVKPQTDKVVCEYLGYDPEVWQKKLDHRERLRNEEQGGNIFGSPPGTLHPPGTNYLPSLMDMQVQPPGMPPPPPAMQQVSKHSKHQ